MARLVEMPKLSPTMEEGQIATWHKAEGDAVEVDDLLAEVETDKATMEFRSFDSGVLLKILAPEGAVVKLGDPVAIIGEKGDDISALTESAASSTPATAAPLAPAKAAPASAPPAISTPAPSGAADTVRAHASAAPKSSGAARPLVATSVDATGRVKASPYVRKLARERSLDLRRVEGSGPGGRIVARDLEGAAGGSGVSTGPVPHAAAPRERQEPEIRPLSMMRKTIARRLTESKQTVPHFYLTIDVNAGPLVGLRQQLNADLGSLPEPPKVSFNDLVIKAVAVAITRSPAVNAQFSPEALIYHRRVDISVAVAVDEGLVTPVVRDADQKSVLAISREVRELAERARSKKLTPEEMTGGTFSISNLGMYGIDEFAAVINPPEGAILAVGGIRDEPVVSGGAVVPGKRMRMTLSCDHRVVDGAIGAAFLAELRKVLEGPTQILAL